MKEKFTKTFHGYALPWIQHMIHTIKTGGDVLQLVKPSKARFFICLQTFMLVRLVKKTSQST